MKISSKGLESEAGATTTMVPEPKKQMYCPQCAEPFTPATSGQEFCTPQCSWEHYE